MAAASRLAVGVVVLVVGLLSFAGGWLSGRAGLFMSVPAASLDERERAFTERMQHAVLDGWFTVDGREAPPRPDRYEIASVEKVGDGLWRFNAHLVHEGMDATLPIVVPVQWVGDTPMVMLTDYSIPSLGTFTARVFFYDTRYAGTWQHGDQVGGQLFGRIEH
ncbi:MAG: hypothetical protein R2712_23080 [Vicinamibacterales bacterium]